MFSRVAGLTHDEANVLVVSEIFAGLDTRASLPGVEAAFEAFRPDVVLHESCEFAGALLAERAGLPRVCVGIGMGASEQLVIDPVNERLQRVPRRTRPARGRPARRRRLLHARAAGAGGPAAPGAPGARRFRENGRAAAAPLPAWWDGDDAPLVYVTFGSVAPTVGFFPDLYRDAIDALDGVEARVLVTTGDASDPAELGALPANVHAERWVAQARVMPEAAAMVCHGGFGTVRAGLAAGVPMAVLPLFADQPYNARRIAELRAGVALEGGPAAVAGLRDAVCALLEDPVYWLGAEAVAAEIRALPPVGAAAEILRELAAR